ncbi:MAG: hypothetical protein ACWGHO_00070 [Candidatus Moraniibacteriota bacterium]
MQANLNNEKIKKRGRVIFFSIILIVAISGLLFYAGLFGIGALQQYNERRMEGDSSWLYAVDGRGCNDLLNLSDEEFEKALSSDLNNISSRKKSRMKRTLEEMQRDKRYDENCKFAQKRLLEILNK